MTEKLRRQGHSRDEPTDGRHNIVLWWFVEMWDRLASILPLGVGRCLRV